MSYFLMGSTDSGSAGCPQCCWRTSGCLDSLRITIPFSGPPIPPPTNTTYALFNDAPNGTQICTTQTYVTPPSTSGANRIWDINVWQAFQDGAWSSSVVIYIFSRSVTGTLTFGPINDTALTCWQSFAYTPLLADCGTLAAGSVVATITILDDGSMSIA